MVITMKQITLILLNKAIIRKIKSMDTGKR